MCTDDINKDCLKERKKGIVKECLWRICVRNMISLYNVICMCKLLVHLCRFEIISFKFKKIFLLCQ